MLFPTQPIKLSLILNALRLLKKKDLEVYIDGPYGTPATEIFEAEHAVLVAAGIGTS